jgi:serine/threonine protein kinase
MGNLCQPYHPGQGPRAYKEIKILGSGSFATVHLAKRFSDRKKFAIKKYHHDPM